MTLLADITGIKPTALVYEKDTSLIQPSLIFGVELEAEGVEEGLRHMVSEELLEVTTDGSLRNNGVEVVTRELFGKDAVKAVTEGCRLLQRANAVVNHRTGLHVHLNVVGFSVEDLVSLLVAVAIAEPSLYNYVGEERRNNIYCLPIGDTDNLLTYLNDIKYCKRNPDIRRAIESTQKYSGFNILPILTQGSVEFRQHPGTIDETEVLRWVNILMGIHRVATQWDAVELSNLPTMQLREVLFPRSTLADMVCPLDVAPQLIERGRMTAKDILNYNKLDSIWEQVKDIYSKPSRITGLN